MTNLLVPIFIMLGIFVIYVFIYDSLSWKMKTIYYSLFIISMVYIIVAVLQPKQNDFIIIDETTFFSGTDITEPKKELSEFEKFELLDKKTLKYPIQPQTSYGNREKNTEALKTYAKSNMKTIDIPQTTGGYLYIKLRGDPPSNRSAVIYLSSDGWYCGGGIKQMGYTYNNNEYLYKLEDVKLIGTSCGGDFRSKISGSKITIGGYVGTFDGNGIEEITIARY